MSSERGLGNEFPSTHWSLLAIGHERGSKAAALALQTLARSYWKPVYAYVRARWARSDEDAGDATQEFFVWMLESDFLSRADPDRGRFRGFVKVSLANFMTDVERKKRTIKRGAKQAILSIEGADDLPGIDPADGAKAPEEVLDDTWRAEVLTQATERLETELTQRDKRACFLVFRDYFLAQDELDYARVAETHGITKVDVSNHLAFAKKRYRAHLAAVVRETVRDDAELEDEMRSLLGGAK